MHETKELSAHSRRSQSNKCARGVLVDGRVQIGAALSTYVNVALYSWRGSGGVAASRAGPPV